MAHHIYHTRGVILESRPQGESNRYYKIFTDELGLVGATAQAVREGKSKLRYTLQDYSLVTVDLVRGKEVWRIVSAGAWMSLPNIKKDETRLQLFVQLLAFLTRLLHGEARDNELFRETLGVAKFLERESVPEELALSFETITKLRVLIHLGYMDKEGYEDFLELGEYSQKLLEKFESVRQKTLPKIAEALNASHL